MLGMPSEHTGKANSKNAFKEKSWRESYEKNGAKKVDMRQILAK